METHKLLENIQELFNTFAKGNNDLYATKVIEEIKKAKNWDKFIESEIEEINKKLHLCKEAADEKFTLFKEVFLHEIENQFPKYLATKSFKLTLPEVMYDRLAGLADGDKKDISLLINDVVLEYLYKASSTDNNIINSETPQTPQPQVNQQANNTEQVPQSPQPQVNQQANNAEQVPQSPQPQVNQQANNTEQVNQQ